MFYRTDPNRPDLDKKNLTILYFIFFTEKETNKDKKTKKKESKEE